MDYLKHPSVETWETRQSWFENKNEELQEIGSHFLSEQACALAMEIEKCFCAGAWVSVIILSLTAIDAHLRETETMDYAINTKKLFEELGLGEEYQQLRKKRNELIHVKEDNPALTVDQQWDNREELEAEAKKAVEQMFKVFYSNPGT